MLQTTHTERKTCILWSKHIFLIKTKIYIHYVFPKIVNSWYGFGKTWHSRTGHRWQCDMAHALCMLDKWGYRHTLRICPTYCFPRENKIWFHGCSLILRLYVLLLRCKFVVCWLHLCDIIRENKRRGFLVALLCVRTKFHENPSVCWKKGKNTNSMMT